eukprot:2512087-Alexandrium_andersonii.AAC.1
MRWLAPPYRPAMAARAASSIQKTTELPKWPRRRGWPPPARRRTCHARAPAWRKGCSAAAKASLARN